MQTKNENISIENIKVGYDDKIIIKDLKFQIPLGKITTIIGPNGCGKSTFLKSLGRIIGLKHGAILLHGEKIHKIPSKELAKEMAILPQTSIAPEGITVEELVSYGRFPHQSGIGKLKQEDKDIIDWALKATDLENMNDIEVDRLSGGQRQRVWIAMALAQKTDIILLDEPTTYLDMAYQLEVLELLEHLNKEYGCTIIMVLHDLNLAARFADVMIALKKGSLIKLGTSKEVMTKEVLKEVYEIDANIIEEPTLKRPICISYDLLRA